jgi:hypothetical protein
VLNDCNRMLKYNISQIHGFNTRRNFDLYRPQTNLSLCQRGPYYFSKFDVLRQVLYLLALALHGCSGTFNK